MNGFNERYVMWLDLALAHSDQSLWADHEWFKPPRLSGLNPPLQSRLNYEPFNLLAIGQ